MEKNKLVLGTVQLGLDYGIANKTGKPTPSEAIEIMKYAVENGVLYFDTAYNYGYSEIIIGKFLNIDKSYRDKVSIITKMPPLNSKELSEGNINDYFFESLRKLGEESIYCYMVHDFGDIEKNCDKIGKAFLNLKERGYIKKIGISVYDNFQIKFLLNNFSFDLIQLPISVFDQRLIKDNSLFELKKKNIEIHARSVFLQGLMFLNGGALPKKLRKFEDYIKRLNSISSKFNFLKEEIALLFVNTINEIDKIVIGIEKISQLQDDIESLGKSESFNKIKTLINFEDLSIKDINIIDPRRWHFN